MNHTDSIRRRTRRPVRLACWTLVTFTLTVAAAACTQPPEPDTGIPGLISTKDFAAWVNAMPGPNPPELIVTGTLVFATAGYRAELVPANPQGFNPRILLLDLVVQPPTGPVAQVVTEVPVRYESTSTGYDAVTILPIGVNLDVETAW